MLEIIRVEDVKGRFSHTAIQINGGYRCNPEYSPLAKICNSRSQANKLTKYKLF